MNQYPSIRTGACDQEKFHDVDKETISQALSNLELHSLNQDFTNLVTCLANGSINPTDQPILNALDFACF